MIGFADDLAVVIIVKHTEDNYMEVKPLKAFNHGYLNLNVGSGRQKTEAALTSRKRSTKRW